MKKKLFGFLAIFALILTMAACGGNNDDNDTAKNNDNGKGNETTTANAGDAEKLFNQKCSTCHGANLEGGAGPNLTKVGSKYSKDEILGIIENGKSGGMPAGQLKGDDAEAVATWLSEKK